MEVFTIVAVLLLQFAQVDCFVTVGTLAAQVQGKVQQLAVHRVTLKSQAGAIIPDEGTSSQALRFPVVGLSRSAYGSAPATSGRR